jgi:hypothetical protein
MGDGEARSSSCAVNGLANRFGNELAGGLVDFFYRLTEAGKATASVGLH